MIRASRRTRRLPKLYAEWTGEARYGSPLVDHLPLVKGIPTPNDVLGYYAGAPQKLTYYADILKYYQALAAATPRVRVEPIGRSDEGRELVVVWVSSEQNLQALGQNRDNLARVADPRGLSTEQINKLIAATKPHYHLIGGLHSSETGAPEMLMELVYRLAVESSPFINQIRDNVYVSVTPVADADGRDRVVDWFYRGLEAAQETAKPPVPAAGARGQPAGGRAAAGGGQRGSQPEGERAEAGRGERGGQAGGIRQPSVPGAGTCYHDNNRDINVALVQMRALTDWYFTAHPPIMHDLHESMSLMYTYSGGPPQNPNLDPLLFAELPWFSNWELAQMTKWGMPGVYTHAFMDGWSPGYLASVAYNHNGVMRMYQTQSGRDTPSPAATAVQVAPARAAATGQKPARTSATPPAGRPPQQAPPPAAAPTPSAPAASAAPAPATAAGAPPGPPAIPGGGRASAVPTGRGGTQDREWYRGLPVPPNAAATFSRRANTNYMADRRPVGAPARSGVPARDRGELLHQDTELDRGRTGQAAVRLCDSGAA